MEYKYLGKKCAGMETSFQLYKAIKTIWSFTEKSENHVVIRGLGV